MIMPADKFNNANSKYKNARAMEFFRTFCPATVKVIILDYSDSKRTV
jgi:hypothetical protein